MNKCIHFKIITAFWTPSQNEAIEFCYDVETENLLIASYLMRKSLKFCKDPSFWWGDISLFVTMSDLDLKFLSLKNKQKKTQS